MAVLRPPMIYGKGCRGNYQSLRRLILKTPMFPRCGNQRSMLYVGNLCLFMGRLLESGQGGFVFPQNREYVSTDGLAREIAKANGKKLWQPKGFGGLLWALGRRSSLFRQGIRQPDLRSGHERMFPRGRKNGILLPPSP